MRIAFFTNTILEHGGGLEKYFIETAAGLASRYPHLKISIVTFNEKRTEILQRILSVYYFKPMPIKNIYRERTEDILRTLGRVRYIKCATFLDVKSELKKYDLIYSKNEIIDLAILKFFGYRNLPPIIAGIHTPIHYPVTVSVHAKLHNVLYAGFLYKYLLRGLRGIHVSNTSNEKLIQVMGFKGSVFKIFHPFFIQQIPFEQSASDQLRILFVGRISQEKGIDILIDCIQQLATRTDFLNFSFRIAGSGDIEPVKTLKKLSHVYKNVEYMGHIPNVEIGSMYAWSDIVLIPSHFETFNYVALEAGSYGKIAIASDIPGPQDIIENGKTGYLLPVNKGSFLEKILEMSALKKQDKEEFTRVGLSARALVQKKFDPDHIYTDFYRMLLECTSNNN